MNCPASRPYESPLVQQALGSALRPGGLDLTVRALDKCGFSPGARVLDLGCGLGTSLMYMARERGFRALGLDLSAVMLTRTKQNHEGVALLQAEADRTPLASSSLDGVLCECVLSLAPDPGAVLAECARVLKPGGYLALSDIYLRNPEAAQEEPDLPGCLGGALDRDRPGELACSAGLEVLDWEDHSPLLKRLAARLVWEQGSLSALWGGCAEGNGCHEMEARIRAARPGYFLMVAQRKANHHG